MTKTDYLQLIQNSPAFQRLDGLVRQRVLDAEGALMDAYLKIFLNEKKLLESAQKQFLEENERIVRECGEELKTIKKEKLKQDEIIYQQFDQTQADALLQQANNL